MSGGRYAALDEDAWSEDDNSDDSDGPDDGYEIGDVDGKERLDG